MFLTGDIVILCAIVACNHGAFLEGYYGRQTQTTDVAFGMFTPVGHPGPTAEPASGQILGGSKNSPVKIEVFSDFECPACRELYLVTIRQVLQEYSSKDKVCVIYHEFPLSSHRYSRRRPLGGGGTARTPETAARARFAFHGSGSLVARRKHRQNRGQSSAPGRLHQAAGDLGRSFDQRGGNEGSGTRMQKKVTPPRPCLFRMSGNNRRWKGSSPIS